jgi:hypothetical protein
MEIKSLPKGSLSPSRLDTNENPILPYIVLIPLQTPRGARVTIFLIPTPLCRFPSDFVLTQVRPGPPAMALL